MTSSAGLPVGSRGRAVWTNGRRSLERHLQRPGIRTWIIAAAVLLAAAVLGRHATRRLSVLLVVAGVGVFVLADRRRSLLALVVVALLGRIEFSTGTQVKLNPITLVLPIVCAVWGLDSLARGRRTDILEFRLSRPLALFLAAGALSLVVGNVLWDPAVPRGGNLVLVQLAQLGIFGLSAAALWLVSALTPDVRTLQRLAYAFLAVGGTLALLRVAAIPGLRPDRIATEALTRSSFWVLLAAIAGGQVVFNRDLAPGWRVFLWLVLGAVFVYAFRAEQESVSNWAGVATAIGLLAWLRFPRLRWPVALVVAILIALGILIPLLYQFAGGDREWTRSGAARIALIGRVIEVAMRNPITGVGPASYRAYAAVDPFVYNRALWVNPRISAHNNYVDLFAHTGLLGLGTFLWFLIEAARLAWRLTTRHPDGFVGGYVHGVLAAGAGTVVIMMLADWFLPFVYNIGFPGFQASVLVWMFLGGLVVIKRLDSQQQQDVPQVGR